MIPAPDGGGNLHRKREIAMFQGYTQGAIDFLWGLRLNNERSWFQAHKEEFTALVDRPTRELAEQLREEMTEAFPGLGLELKVSRIYRDARRLFGRGPYKDHLWFSLRRPGEHDGQIPCFWFEVAADRYGYGMGCWEMLPSTMAKLRARITRDPAAMEKLTKKLAGQAEFALGTQDYKRPKAAAPTPALEPWFRARSFTLIHQDKLTEELFGREVVERVKTGWRFLLPYYDYFVTLDGDPDPDGT